MYDKKIPDSYIYISHLDEGFKYWLLPTTPDTISDSMQSTFGQTNALGRSAPVFTYSNSGPRQVQVELAIHRDAMDDININNYSTDLGEGEDYIDNLIHALQAIAVPKYNLSNSAIEPPLVALRLCDEVFIKGVVVTPPSLTYGLPILMPNQTGSGAKYANVRFSITIAEVDPYDAQSVYKNGSFRGAIGLLKDNKKLGF